MVQHILDGLQTMPPAPLSLALILLVGPLCVLVHECGHALAADLRVGAAAISINWTSKPGRPGGLCVYDARRATPMDTLVIALSGPAMSAAFALVCWGLCLRAPHTGLWHDITWVGFMANVEGSLVNLLPLKLAQRRGVPTMSLDGRIALEALRALRRAPVATRARPLPPAPARVSTTRTFRRPKP